MKVLIIGGGAIGQVFARHFSAGGAAVHLLVRPRQEAEAQRGFALYPLNRRAPQRDVPVRLEGLTIHTDQDVAMATRFDLVVLAVSSVALRSGDWLSRLGAGLGSASLLGLQAGPEDLDLVAEHVPREQIAWGMLSVISFQAPLPDQTLPEPGVSYWFPPLSKLGFSGSDEVIGPILTTLRRGGMPVARVSDVRANVAFAGAVLNETIHALECANWSFRTLRRDRELLPLAVAAMRESWAVAELTTGARTPLMMRLLRPFLLRWALIVAPWVLPLDLERFFQFHYTKVGEQTLLMMDTHLRQADALGIPAPATRALASRVRAQRVG